MNEITQDTEMDVVPVGSYELRGKQFHTKDGRKFYISKRRKANTAKKPAEFLIQINPERFYISSLYQDDKGFWIEYRCKKYRVKMETDKIFIEND